MPETCSFIKIETLAEAQVFSCEFCEISKNTFFTEHVWATASVHEALYKVGMQSGCIYCTIFAFSVAHFKALIT